jgi:hypothetical protein
MCKLYRLVDGKMARKPLMHRVLLLKHKETGHSRIVVQDNFSYWVHIDIAGSWRTKTSTSTSTSTQHNKT